MKLTLILLAIVVISFVLAYLTAAFVIAQFNFLLWTTDQRGGCVLQTALLCVVGILAFKLNQIDNV
jgi:hypothetical protein